jgi:hypothetical protein
LVESRKTFKCGGPGFWPLAYGSVYKFAVDLKENDETNLPHGNDEALDLATDEGKKKELARKRNNIAMANFTMAFTSEGFMGLVFKVQSPVCKVATWWEGKFGCQGLVGKVHAQGRIRFLMWS